MSRISLGALLLAFLARPLGAQERTMLLEGILRAEDRRAMVPGDLPLLERAVRHPDALVRGRAVRALGRLERPAVLPAIFPLLADAEPGVRAFAAEAAAQAAQGFRSDSSPGGRGALWPALLDTLGRRAVLEGDPGLRGMFAISLGRLPYVTEEEVREARRRVTALLLTALQNPRGTQMAARGWAMLARATGRRFPYVREELAAVRPLWLNGDLLVRRALLGGFIAAGARDSALTVAALGDEDEELRRLALTGMLPPGIATGRRDLLLAALADSVPAVRLEALRAWSRATGTAGCSALVRAVVDPDESVRLTALDLLGGCAGDIGAVAALGDVGREWRPAAHALVSLARVRPASAAALLPEAMRGVPWQRRMYAARAAAVLKDTAALIRLARDSVANVREAALTGLHTTAGHAADSLYRKALGATDYQLVLTAADALGGTPVAAPAAADLAAALTRITREQKETSRDPRIAIMARLHELGTAREAPALLPLLRDFDPAVAESAAVILGAWTGRAPRAVPVRFAPRPVGWVEIEALRNRRLRVTLASGESFDVVLLVDEAPVTVVTVVGLVRQGWYSGRTFHRVVPNFVLQGGSPGANEYAGWPHFLRDELSSLSHARGTLGISTRGRDTGDAQIFVNLVDNPRLDYDYTVWGRVVAGLEVLDRVQEGDVIQSIVLLPR